MNAEKNLSKRNLILKNYSFIYSLNNLTKFKHQLDCQPHYLKSYQQI